MGERRAVADDCPMSIFVWVMIGIAIWHACILVPDRFYGGIIGAFVGAVSGALAAGYLLPVPGLPPHNPPGLAAALWPIPGSLLALVALYRYGVYRERLDEERLSVR
jgi:uncharacterized membrane protein YeaQ/YmgE (transglycosylase-associated protein family)